MRTLVFVSLFILSGTIALAQRGTIKVSVVNDQKAAMENATVELPRVKDSSLAKAAISDKNGIAELESIRFGEYVIKVTLVNYAAAFSSSVTLSETQSAITIPAITMVPGTGHFPDWRTIKPLNF